MSRLGREYWPRTLLDVLTRGRGARARRRPSLRLGFPERRVPWDLWGLGGGRRQPAVDVRASGAPKGPSLSHGGIAEPRSQPDWAVAMATTSLWGRPFCEGTGSGWPAGRELTWGRRDGWVGCAEPLPKRAWGKPVLGSLLQSGRGARCPSDPTAVPLSGCRLHREPVPVRRGRVCEHALQERRQVSGRAQHLHLRVHRG